jgi:hypothetical protein
MKKILFIIFVICISFLLISCNPESANGTTENSETTESSVEESSDNQTTEEDTDSSEEESDDESSGVDIPEEFPTEDIPLAGVETSDMTSSSSEELSDCTNVSVSFQVNDSYDTVYNTIKTTYEGISEDYSEVGGDDYTNISGTANGYDYAISLLEGSEDTTMVTYTVYIPND